MKGNGKDYPIYEMENKNVKPPTSYKWFLIKVINHVSHNH
jgi:hypothetical protein